jgi:DNA polymerase theta
MGITKVSFPLSLSLLFSLSSHSYRHDQAIKYHVWLLSLAEQASSIFLSKPSFCCLLLQTAIFLMEVNKRSGVYHRTTIDDAKSAYTVSRAGQKRTLDELQERQTGANIPVLGNVSNNIDFRRPSLSDSCYPALRAGEIRDVSSRGISEYTQRRTLALTPTPTSNPLLELSHPSYGLPEELVHNFATLGIRSIYPWQAECLLRSGALNGERNLVYSAPTGGGKSLVADILMLKKVIETPEKKALLVLPYVALVQEKVRWLRRVVEGITKKPADSDNKQRNSLWRKRGDEENVRVVGFFGGSKSKATWADLDIAVCTIEKVCSQPEKEALVC